MQLSTTIKSPIQQPQRRLQIPHAQNKGIPVQHGTIVIKNIKTAHNRKSKCQEKIMSIHKITHKIRISTLRPHRPPKIRKIEITQLKGSYL